MSDKGDGKARPGIVVVDDTPANLEVLGAMLGERGFRARLLPSGKLALASIAREPPELVLLDIMMPEMDGYEVCRRLKEEPRLAEIPVIFLSALSDAVDKVEAFRSGGVDYVTKPFQIEEVLARVETHLRLRRLQRELAEQNRHLEERVEAQVEEITRSQMAAILAVSTLAESRDRETGRHLERVQSLCRRLALEMSRSPRYQVGITPAYVENLFHASPLHDIGKVSISDAILRKEGKLTPDEFEVMKTHTVVGASTLETARRKYPRNAFVNMGIAIARSHHERWDGTGYPDGLAGEDIPLCARIMALADVYDALRSRRHYKPPRTHEEARELIVVESGRQFDPGVVDAFVAAEADVRAIRDGLGE